MTYEESIEEQIRRIRECFANYQNYQQKYMGMALFVDEFFYPESTKYRQMESLRESINWHLTLLKGKGMFNDGWANKTSIKSYVQQLINLIGEEGMEGDRKVDVALSVVRARLSKMEENARIDVKSRAGTFSQGPLEMEQLEKCRGRHWGLESALGVVEEEIERRAKKEPTNDVPVCKEHEEMMNKKDEENGSFGKRKNGWCDGWQGFNPGHVHDASCWEGVKASQNFTDGGGNVVKRAFFASKFFDTYGEGSQQHAIQCLLNNGWEVKMHIKHQDKMRKTPVLLAALLNGKVTFVFHDE